MTRWTDWAYLLLIALAERENHGYALAVRARELRGGDASIGAGTLYSTLDRLERAAMIEFVRDELVDGRSRRVYAITSGGRALLAGRASQLASELSTIRTVLGPA